MTRPHATLPSLSRLTRSLGALIALTCALAALSAVAHGAPLTAASPAETSGSVDSSATTVAPLPDQMARLGGAKQLIVATGAKLGDTTGTLQFFDRVDSGWVCTLTVPCRFGKHGLMDGAHRWSGNKTTPTGIWKMPSWVFGNPKRSPVTTKMGYRRITKKSWWSSRWDKTYNTWVEAKRWPGEYLYHVVPQYDLAVSTGYNAKPNYVRMGRGSGIFLHIQGSGFTSGCVAIPRSAMSRVVRLLDPAKAPAFAVGTLATGTPTAIWAY